ncbi:MAG: mannose-1-phosphate guanylyltransferase [Candidatus Flexifilum sp.]
MSSPYDHYYALIMAGGGGTRLWPLSRSGRPKQMLPLVEARSMFQVSVDRLAPLFSPERVYVVAGRAHIDLLRAQAPDIPPANFIAEPYARDNGPAAALGIQVISSRDPEATIAYLPSDHHIGDTARFRRALAAAYAIAQQDLICTLGITPSTPSTGFGYIQRGPFMNTLDGFDVFQAVRFKEKPDYETAVQYVLSGEYSWNAGMFIMRASTALREFRRQQPTLADILTRLAPTIDTDAYESTLNALWDEMPRLSIDYAIMEHAERMAVIPVEIGWSDVGSWEALHDILQRDDHGNSARGDHLFFNTRDTMVFSSKMTVTIGVHDLIIVETDDVLLVCERSQSQAVKDVVTQLKGRRDDLL